MKQEMQKQMMKKDRCNQAADRAPVSGLVTCEKKQ